MDNAKANAVLETAEQLFCEMEVLSYPPVVGNGPQVIAERLGLSPAEVVVHLRMHHREGRIGLLNGIGANITIARSQEQLQAPVTVVTGGGKSIKLSKGRRSRPPEDEVLSEDAEASDASQLLSRITQLERELKAARAAAEKAETRRRNMGDARQRSDEAKASVEEELRRVKAENRSLAEANKTLQAEADKVSDLERQIAELKRPRALPDDLAATIARLTDT
jgi:hypothetical protein